MTAKYDPETADRLRRFKVVPRAKCTECTSGYNHRVGAIGNIHDEWDEPCDACFSTGLAAVQNLAATCDQLEAASLEILALKNANASLIPGGILVATEVECLRVERDRLAAEVKQLTDALNHAIAENLAFNVKVAGEINEARSDRDEWRHRAIDWQVRTLAAEFVAEAAIAWRHAVCDKGPDCGDGYTYHAWDCPTVESMRGLVDAVDHYQATRSKTG